jgi:hypothetical protein
LTQLRFAAHLASLSSLTSLPFCSSPLSQFPATYITTYAILNDFVNIAITTDRAIPLLQPDKWRLSQIGSVGVSLACTMAALSYAHFFVARDGLGYSGSELDTVMFCQISFLQRFVACSTRLKSPWWRRPYPSPTFLLAIFLSHLLTILFAVFGVLSARLPIGVVFALFGIELAFALGIDGLKLALYRIPWITVWTTVLPLTGQQMKRRMKHEATQRANGRSATVRKIWKAVHVITAVRKLWTNQQAAATKADEIRSNNRNEPRRELKTSSPQDSEPNSVVFHY